MRPKAEVKEFCYLILMASCGNESSQSISLKYLPKTGLDFAKKMYFAIPASFSTQDGGSAKGVYTSRELKKIKNTQPITRTPIKIRFSRNKKNEFWLLIIVISIES